VGGASRNSNGVGIRSRTAAKNTPTRGRHNRHFSLMKKQDENAGKTIDLASSINGRKRVLIASSRDGQSSSKIGKSWRDHAIGGSFNEFNNSALANLIKKVQSKIKRNDEDQRQKQDKLEIIVETMIQSQNQYKMVIDAAETSGVYTR
jgi:hypothetical protein